MSTNHNVSQVLNNMPLIFEKNKGQNSEDIKFICNQKDCTTHFKKEDIEIFLRSKKEDDEVNSIKISLENINKNCEVIGLNKLNCKVAYFKGSNKDKWIKDVETYEKIKYKEIYPSIDLIYYSKEGNIKYDFIIKPNANHNDIKFNFNQIDNMIIDNEGNLEIKIKENTIKFLKPVTYQEINSNIININSEFLIENNSLKFHIEEYDKENTLIIDPQILYSTYLGGVASTNIENSVVVDEEENAYIVGSTTKTLAKYAYLIKVNTKKKGIDSLIYIYYLGGNNETRGYSVALDKFKNVYLTGYTYATDFPIVNGFQTKPLDTDCSNGYLTKIDNNASTILYSTYIGGEVISGDVWGVTIGYGVAVDKDQNAYVTGFTTTGKNFPVKNGYNTDYQLNDGFLIKIGTTQIDEDSLLYGTFLVRQGLESFDSGNSVVVDDKENAYVIGKSDTYGIFIVDNGINTWGPGSFLIQIDTTTIGAESQVYGTYIRGDNGYTEAKGIALDNENKVYITGFTSSSSLLITKDTALYPDIQGKTDGFLQKINTEKPGIEGLMYGTYIGGNDSTEGASVVVDNDKVAYITGWTNSSVFKYQPLQGVYQGKGDAYLLGIDTTKSGQDCIVYGMYLGGKSVDAGTSIALDLKSNIYIVGNTDSQDFPVDNGFDNNLETTMDGFLTKIGKGQIQLELKKDTCKCIAKVGEKIPYTIKVKNNGPDTAYNILVKEIIPKNVYINSISASEGTFSVSDADIIWTIPKLPQGSLVTAMIVMIPNPNICYLDDTNIINTCEIFAINGELIEVISETTITYIDCFACKCKK